MRRYPAFDPPEYVDWSPQPELVEAFARRVAEGDRAEVVAGLSEDDLLALHRDLLRTRLHDIQLQRWVRTGVISKAWLGTGEEAVTVGAVAALDGERDCVMPMIRNAGALHMMGMPLANMLRGYLGSRDSPSGGRDLHIGDLHRGVLQPVSQMGSNVPIVTGVALSYLRRGEPNVALTWVGDGATKTGACHEGLNLAAVLGVPAVFVLQNNQVALGTTVAQHGAGDLGAWPDMYGLPHWACNGNNVLDVYACVRLAADACREGSGPAMVIAETFRMGGHATHDEREARATFAAELFESWGRRDPIGLYEAHLTRSGIDRAELERIEESVTREIETAADEAAESRDLAPAGNSAEYQGISQGGVLSSLARRPV